MKTMLATFKKNRITVTRAYPLSFTIQRIINSFFGLLVPVLIYYLVFNQTIGDKFSSSTNTTDYILFVTLGYSSYSVSVATLMNVGRSLITEIREGTIDPFLISPASRTGYFLGTFIEQLLRTSLEFFIIIIFGIILGARISLTNMILLLPSLFLITIASFSIAILLSSFMVFTRDTFISQNTLFFILALITGISFPIHYLPKVIQSISTLIPLTHANNIMRTLIIGTGTVTLNDIFILISECLVYLIIGALWFNKIEKKLIEEVYS